MNPTNAVSSQTQRLNADGTQDTSGWGLLGLAGGIIAGFLGSFYLLIPLFPKDNSTLMLTLMTTTVTAAMTIGGVLGYLATRRKSLPDRRA